MPETEVLPLLAVFDVDGVVADVRHRLDHITRRPGDRTPKDWSAFFAAADRDPPLAEGIELAREYAKTHVLVWLTGRPEYLRPVTERWLRAQGLPYNLLFMRPPTDRRPARDYKASQLARMGREAEIAVVIDDDPDVVARLLKRGLPVRLADWVPYGETLRQAQEREGRT